MSARPACTGRRTFAMRLAVLAATVTCPGTALTVASTLASAIVRATAVSAATAGGTARCLGLLTARTLRCSLLARCRLLFATRLWGRLASVVRIELGRCSISDGHIDADLSLHAASGTMAVRLDE